MIWKCISQFYRNLNSNTYYSCNLDEHYTKEYFEYDDEVVVNFKNLLNTNELFIFDKVVLECYTHLEVSNQLNISRERVTFIVKKLKNKFKEMIESER